YVALPVAFRHDPSYRYSNWHHLPSPYGPLFTLLSQGLGVFSVPVAYWVWKALLLAASAGTLAVVADTARRLGRSRRTAIALVGLAAAGAVAWRRAWLPAAAGAVMLTGVLTLGWTMPWYVWWILPFAALARTRWLTGGCVLLSVWLALGAIPQSVSLMHRA